MIHVNQIYCMSAYLLFVYYFFYHLRFFLTFKIINLGGLMEKKLKDKQDEKTKKLHGS